MSADNPTYDDAFKQHAVVHEHRHRAHRKNDPWQRFLQACDTARMTRVLYGHWVAVGKPASPQEFQRLWKEREELIKSKNASQTQTPQRTGTKPIRRSSRRKDTQQKTALRRNTANSEVKDGVRDTDTETEAEDSIE